MASDVPGAVIPAAPDSAKAKSTEGCVNSADLLGARGPNVVVLGSMINAHCDGRCQMFLAPFDSGDADSAKAKFTEGCVKLVDLHRQRAVVMVLKSMIIARWDGRCQMFLAQFDFVGT